ncbi:MAG: hypothetical protein EXS64_15830 [Candidatus Latescibacteria bacterium]|nr:hypothetical protein [Candidatus Latescibacterota bacterium]
MRAGALLLMLVIAALAGGCGKKDVFASKEGGFSVETSSVPKQKKETVPTLDGPVDVYTLTFEIQNPALEYWIVYIDYPEATVRQKGPGQLLKEARDGSVDNVHGRLLKERDISLEGYPGKEIEYEGEGAEEDIYKSRMYLVKQRIYVILVTAPRNGASEHADKFLNSFKLM